MADEGAEHPWAQIPVGVARRINSTCGAASFYVYVILRSFDNPEQPGECFPSLQAIAERSGLCVRSVKRHIAKLKAAGVLKVQGRGRAPNRYYFPLVSGRKGQAEAPTPEPSDEGNMGTTGVPTKPVMGTTGVPTKALEGTGGVPTNGYGDNGCPHKPTYGDNPWPFMGTPGVPSPPLTTPPSQGVPDHYQTTTASIRSTPTREDRAADDAGLPVVVVEYVKKEKVEREALDIFHGQLARARAEHGEQPVRRALAELAHALGNGQRPSCPQKLPNYFAPILERNIREWLRERREQEEAEARARAERERMAQVAREAEQRRRLGKRLFQASRLRLLKAMRGHAAPRAP